MPYYLTSMFSVLLTYHMILCLRLMGRPWWCKCRTINFWATGEDHYSQHLFDPWTVTHVGWGIAIYAFARATLFAYPSHYAILVAFSLGALFEILENTSWAIKAFRRAGDKAYFGDSIINSCGDMIAFLVGSLFTSYFV